MGQLEIIHTQGLILEDYFSFNQLLAIKYGEERVRENMNARPK